MSWRNKLSGVPLIVAFNLLIYFARSFPVLTHYQTNPELGPFFEGDIKGNPLDRNGIPEEIFRWKKGIFRFYVQDDYSFQEMYKIYSALLEITSATCIEVDELLKSGHQDHAYYSPDKGVCASPVGFRLGRQVIDLGPNCLIRSHGTAIHETLHSLGFFHEQSREDRNDYVTINFDNILPANRKNFNRYRTNAFGVPYDYGSIMHYGAYDFAIDKNMKTIVVKQPGAEIGQRDKLSSSDIEKVNRMYTAECDSRSWR